MKYDPHNSQETYRKRKLLLQRGELALSSTNQRLIEQYLADMERGLNVGSGSKKGGRSSLRLLGIIQHLCFVARKLQECHQLDDLTKIDEATLHEFFANMRNGKLRRRDGKPFRGTGNFVRDFKAFWHWHMKVQRKYKNLNLTDICVDLDTTDEKPRWVYLTEDEVRKLCNYARFDYRVLMMFLFDSGVRSPTELMNIRVCDLSNDVTKLNIRDEVSKTFGRRINLLMCPPLLSEYIRAKQLGSEDSVFHFSPAAANRYLKRLATRVLGQAPSPAGEKYSNLTMYDFRHSSACYWLPRYKSEAALKYRFGWKKSDEIHYYTELLGMKDTIQQEDLLFDVNKTELEQRLGQSERDRQILKERVDVMQQQIKQLRRLTREILGRFRDVA